MMWSDPIEQALLQMREALAAIQRGHNISFGELDRSLAEALQVRTMERQTGKLTQP